MAVDQPWLREDASGVLLSLYVQPGAKKSGWQGEHGGLLKLRLAAPAVDGAANRALLKFLAETLHCSKSQITLIRGETSRQKTVHIEGVSLDAIAATVCHPPR